jgi:transcriptional regulator with XRE-family HTH domain
MGKRDENTTGAVAAARLRAIRKASGLSLREVAERLAEVGHPLNLTGVSKLENGTRRMDVDDLTALAAVLRVSPATLLMPEADYEGKTVSITGVTNDARTVWNWLTSQEPLPGEHDVLFVAQNAVPRWVAVEMLDVYLDGLRASLSREPEEES